MTSRAKRAYTGRGSRPSPAGRPRKGQLLSKQLVVSEESESVFHKLPGAKKVKKKQLHSIMEAVRKNRGAGKKH